MDILVRLRILLWAMVLLLWGLMIHQFLGGETELKPRMRWVSAKISTDAAEELPDLETAPQIPLAELFGEKPAADLGLAHSSSLLAQLPAPPLPPPPAAAPAAQRTFVAPLPEYRGPAPAPQKPSPRPRAAPETPKQRPSEEEAIVPRGFVKTVTDHFIVYSQGEAASRDFLETLGSLHGNLMLDLASFSPWAREEKVSIYLFQDQESYQKVTGRPSWSGGASSVKRRKIYVYASEELIGILAHELCHIYFDGFFAAGNPLWLSEGMATLIQTERGLAAPNWLKGNLETLRSGGGYPLSDLMRIDSTGNAEDAEVRLWYTQAYSLVRFMVRAQRKSSFYRFCRMLREGSDPRTALYQSYGMPFTSLHALESAWRHAIEQN